MSDLRKAHEQEAMELALELYNLEARREEVKERLSQIAVILQTAKHYEGPQAAPEDGAGPAVAPAMDPAGEPRDE
jgi:hypothetical protein